MNDEAEDTIPMGVTLPPLNAEDQDQIEVATLQATRRSEIEALDLKTVFAMPEGRRFITRILQLTGIQCLSDPDPVLVQRSEGARAVGLEILKILHSHSIHAYPQLLVEAAIQLEQDQKERDAALISRTTASTVR